MWFSLFFLFIAACIVHARYFSKVVSAATREVFSASERWLRPLRWGYLLLACSVPIFLLGYAAYVLIAKPESFGFPHHWLIDLLLIYPFWFVTIWSFQTTLFVLPVGIGHWLARKLGFLRAPVWVWRRSVLVLVLSAGFLIYMPIRIAVDLHGLDTRHYQVAVEGLPQELDGFEIALISDPQADPYTGEERLSQMVRAVQREEPDLVLIAGDIITRPPEYIELAARVLGRLKAPHGVYSCIGDHDNFAYRDRERSLREVREGLARVGIPMLDNEVETIEVDGAELAVIAVTSNYVNRASEGLVKKLVHQARGAGVRVLLAHQATQAVLDGGSAAELMLTGHMHGGQVSFLTPVGLMVLARIESPHITGRYSVGDSTLIVSGGLGLSVAPFRYHSNATVDIVRLERAAARGSR